MPLDLYIYMIIYIYIYIFRGGYRISEKGGGVRVTVNYQNLLHLRAHAQGSPPPLYVVWGAPKNGEGGGAVRTPKTPPPPLDPPLPDFAFNVHYECPPYRPLLHHKRADLSM